MYEYTDKAIKQLNRKYIKLFRKLSVMPFDELNIIQTTTTVYDTASALAVNKYVQIAIRAYAAALALVFGSAAKAMATDIDADWVLDYLEETDPVTLYKFFPEVGRKKQRLIEALAATTKRKTEIDKALRYWTLQSSQYAIDITDAATLKAYKDAGIKKVRWVTEDDDRVCKTCGPRHNKVYDIDKVPSKPHFNCRCMLLPVKEKTNGNS